MAAWSSGLRPTHGDVTQATMSERIVTIDPDVMGGTPVFAGTRVPVRTLLDYLEGGETIDQFLEGFPSVSREQVIAFLEAASRQIVAAAS
jgi:uncharacterized protein (DUF433 family)